MVHIDKKTENMVQRKHFATRRCIAILTVAVYLGVEVGLFFLMGEEYSISYLRGAALLAYGAYFYKRQKEANGD